MKNLFDSADQYLRESSWRDIAVLKFCLLSLGLLAGMQVPERHREKTAAAAAFLFIVTYIPAVTKYLRILIRKEKTR